MLDFSRQYAEIREELLEAIARVCDSQRFILGPAVDSFEQAAAHACATPHAIGCASGTDALWLAMAAAGIGTSDRVPTSFAAPPDAVITTPFSFFASVSAILRCGARPILADIDPLTFNLSPTAVQAVLQSHPDRASIKAILPVHLYGQCADMDAFAALQRDHPSLLLIEDAAQAFGAAWNGIPAGALGDAAAFSFYPTKNLSAFGDAGLVTTRSAQLDTHARSLRAHGMTRRYYHDEVGWNSRLDSIQAAVLEVKLRHLPRWNEKRRTLAARYDHLFRAANLTAPTTAEGIVLPWIDPPRPPHLPPVHHPCPPPRRPPRPPGRPSHRQRDLLPPAPPSPDQPRQPRLQKRRFPRVRARSQRSPCPAHLPRATRRRATNVVEATRAFYA